MSKVLFLLQLPPPIHGSSVMGDVLYKSHLINTSFGCSHINLMTSRKLNEIGKNPLKKVFRYAKIFLKLLHQLILFNPDLVYFAINAKGIAFYKDFILILLIKLFRKKYLLHFHNKGVSESNNLLDVLSYRLLFNNSKVILLTPRLYRDISNYIDINHVFYSPNGISMPKYQIKKRRKKKIVKLLFLSNLFFTKGVFVLVNALYILKKQNLNFQCNIVGGEGDISFQLIQKKINELGLNKHIKLHGKKFGNDKFKFYEKSDIFIFPSYYETFGLVNLEAMFFGLPVISTDEGGIPDIVDDKITGLIAKKRDSVDLAKKIKFLITNPKISKIMGQKGRDKFFNCYTTNIFEKRIKNIINDCIKS